MILGFSTDRRNSLYDTPYKDDKGARLGEVVAVALREAVDQQGHMTALDAHIASYVSRGKTVSAEPEIARAYVGSLDRKDEYAGTYEAGRKQAHQIIDGLVELRLTAIESDEVVGVGLLRAVDFKAGRLLLASPKYPQLVVDFAHGTYSGKGRDHTYDGSALTADFEVMNPGDVDLQPLVDKYLH